MTSLNDLRQQSTYKVLFRGESGTGKTMKSCRITIECLKRGLSVKFVDTEAEGSTTLVNLVEENSVDEDVLENLTYVQVSNYNELAEHISEEVQRKFDLLVLDTLDHKNTFAERAVTQSDLAENPDWNQYPEIYARERAVMETLSNAECSVVSTIDPESGKGNKKKGIQTNVNGFFTAVIILYRDGQEFTHKIENYVGRSDLIGKMDSELVDKLAQKVETRTSV